MKRILLLALLGLSLAGCVYAAPGPGYYHRDYYYRY
jgi:hypothetical protein